MYKTIYNCFEAVSEFHEKNGQLINDTPDKIVPWSIVLLRLRLILEELGELSVAMHEGDLIKIADGLSDLKYVIIGTAVSFGVFLEDDFVPNHLLAKMGDIDSGTEKTQPAQIKSMLLTKLVMAIGAVSRGLALACEPCCGEHDIEIRRHELFEQLVTADHLVSEIARAYGIPLEYVFFEIHRSNMSKDLAQGAKEGGKYAEGHNPKGGSYTPPDIDGILKAWKKA